MVEMKVPEEKKPTKTHFTFICLCEDLALLHASKKGRKAATNAHQL